MAAFPAYLHLKRPSLDRYYYPYPIISRDGPEGSGYRLWPFPLSDRHRRPVERTAASDDEHTTSADDRDGERLTYFPVMRDELDATEPTARDRS